MFELHFVTRTIRATSACAKQPKIGKIATFSEKRVICQFIICVEALRKEQRGGYYDVQILPEDVEVEREYDKQLQRVSAFASKTVLSTSHTYYSSLHILFYWQKLDNYMILFMLALFENIRLFVLRVLNYSIRTKWVFVSPLLFRMLAT